MISTSYSEEYKWPERTTWSIKKWPKDRTLQIDNIKRNNPSYRNSETLTQIKSECLPSFNYLLSNKPIVQTDPKDPLTFPILPKDDDTARATRPRVYKAPEISLDDIADPDIRDKIIEYTYSTTSELANKEGAMSVPKKIIPDCVWEVPDHKLFDKKEVLNTKLCGEMSIGDVENWDGQQSRQGGDPTMTFWRYFRHHKPLDIFGQEDRTSDHTEKILSLAREGCLRQPYLLKPSSNYTGYKPEFPLKIEPRKPEQDLSDPMISVYQLANRWLEN